jgi:hypothetical protein
MRLINAASLQLEEFLGDAPPYAILSHTWEQEEVSHQDMLSGNANTKKGYDKILRTCRQAVEDGLAYAWVDTCCIDKTSSAELSEAINSMFRWYAEASVCYVYLSDLQLAYGRSGAVDLDHLFSDLASCRWFTRGWTLQELIAPVDLRFYDQAWQGVGDKRGLLDRLSRITNISSPVLSHDMPLSAIPAATKMLWAARRQTTKVEDMSYCLLGIFDVFMPLLYGEGSKAFIRLQEEIIKTRVDFSIFAWTKPAPEAVGWRYSGLLADSPALFEHIARYTLTTDHANHRSHSEVAITNRGIRISIRLLLLQPHITGTGSCSVVFPLGKAYSPTKEGWLMTFGVRLRMCGSDLFVRDAPHELVEVAHGVEATSRLKPRPIYAIAQWPDLRLSRVALGPSLMIKATEQMRIGNRNSAIRVALPEGLREGWPRPLSHRDFVDDVFFSTEAFHEGWCSMLVSGLVPLGRNANEDVSFKINCLFVCIGWNVNNLTFPVSTALLDLSSIDSRAFSHLMSILDEENNDHVPWVLRDLKSFGLEPNGRALSWQHRGRRISLVADTRLGADSSGVLPAGKPMHHIDILLRVDS